MADAAVEFLGQNLRELLLNNYNLITGALSEIKEVKDEVKILNAFLRDPAVQQDERLRELARQAREVVYGAEDITDSFMIQEMQAAAAITPVFFPARVGRRLSLAKDLISFRKGKLTRMLRRVEVARGEKQPADGYGICVKNQRTKALKEVPPINSNDIVGFEDEAKILVNYLMEAKEELYVISLTGMPGIGKTTLAWKVYQDETIRVKFPTRIWINVPQQFHAIDFYLSILQEFGNREKNYDQLPDHYLADEVVKVLEQEKFLLVMEDIWTAEAWDAIRVILPKRNKFGRVLITSRNKSVCWHASTNRKPHMLRFRDENESWQLLQLQVFGKLGECPQWLEPMGKRVAENCGGLPLAIEVIASNLVVASSTETARKQTEHWWKKVSENVTMYVTDYNKHHALSGLELSYNKLTDQLRDCFLYFGVFPEDYEIPVRMLTRLWIAEGFVQDTRGLSLEERAVEILYEFIQHNLVMVDKLYPSGDPKTCRVHKVMQGFCKSKALEQNLFQEMNKSEEGALDPQPVSLTSNYRRLSIHSHLPEYLSGRPNGTGVRSILCFTKEANDADEITVLNPKDVSAIHRSFKFLKVLESKSIKFAEFPINLTKLMNLKYISLCCDHLHALPKSISLLLNLQTLVVVTQSQSLEIRADIWRMVGLRHLITKAAIVLARKGHGKHGESLQTLSRLSPDCCTEDVFIRACNLKNLGIRGNLAALLAADTLAKLERLESLKLVNESPNQLSLHVHPDCFPPNLKSLTLSATYLGWEHMPILGTIAALKVLKLKDNAFRGDSWKTDDANGFRCLEFLLINGTDLVSWDATSDCFPCLLRLVLKNCGKLKQIPVSMHKTLDLDSLSESAIERSPNNQAQML